MTRKILTALWAAVVGAAVVGCSHEVESPKPSLESLVPNLVCSANRVEPIASVVINGSNFTPLPTNVLAEPAILMLPTVDLRKAENLPGQSWPDLSLQFSGDPEGAHAKYLSWQSEEQMTFRTDEADSDVKLQPGLYDVTVTNPDKHKKATMAKGLAVVPPPTIESAEPAPPALCTAQSQRQYILNGKDFLVVAGTVPKVTFTEVGSLAAAPAGDAGAAPSGASIDLDAASIHPEGCTAIPGTFAGGKVELCTKLTVDLPMDQAALPPGTYDVVVTSPEPASCKSTDPFKVVIVPPPFVTAIEPPTICVDQTDQVITIQGGSFARVNGTAVPTVTITAADGTPKEYAPDSLDGCVPPPGVDLTFGVELCDSIKFTVKVNDLPPGSYKLTVTNPDPVGCESSDTIDLTVNAPPRVDSVAPATVCSGGSILVATGSGLLPGATAELQCAGGKAVAALSVDVSADGTKATITVGPGIAAGENCDVVLRNADGCEDRPLPHQVVTGTEGPILFNVDPNVAYNGINTKVLLYVTALEAPFTVRMWPSGTAPAQGFDVTSKIVPGKATVIQATIPKDSAPGDYDLQVNDSSGCSASLDKAIVVTDNLTVSTGTVTPNFGKDDASVPVTIVLGSAVTSTGAPRAFLNPPGDTDAIQLQSVTVVDGTTLTAVVPSGTPAGVYDLVIVWPDGQVAVLSDAYNSVTAAPPVISDVVPQSVVSGAGRSIEIRGTGFDASTVTLRCNGGATTITTTAAAPTCTAGLCTQTATFTAGAEGDVCVVRVTNADGAYGEFSAIGVTGASLNLSAPVAGKNLIVGRRALVSSAVKATSAARFLYAIGGDDGTVAGALDSVEFAPIDIFGNMNDWVANPAALGSKRTFAGSATIGRYVYVFGGNAGAGALDTGERALVLSPEEIPVISDLDLCLAGGSQNCFGVTGLGAGLTAGVYSYRVAAVIDPADPQNLGGETLASDPVILRLRSVGTRNATVKITWSAPKDSLGADLSGITGYRVYRTPADGAPGADEVLISDITGTTPLTFIDDGTATLGTAKPLPQGSTSAWQALPAMAAPREGPGGAAAPDPNDPTKWYVYSLLGRDGTTGSTSYEFLNVQILGNGRQTVGTAWTTGTEASTVGRWQLGAWTVNSVISSQISSPTETWLYLGAGLLGDGVNDSGRVDAAMVQAGGELTAFATTQDFSAVRYGYGSAAAAGSLFVFGGKKPGVLQNAIAAKFNGAPPGLAQNSWNNEGLSMTTPRYLMGSTIQSAFIFLVGGDTGAGVTQSTETVVW